MMHLFPTVLIVSLIVMIAALFRSAFGFGESLIAVPLLSMVMPLNAAVPLSVLVSVFVAAFVVAQGPQESLPEKCGLPDSVCPDWGSAWIMAPGSKGCIS